MKLLLLLATALAGVDETPAEPPTTPEARIAVQDFGRCVARQSPGLAAETLSRDFRTRAYSSALRRLARVNETCFRQRGTMRADGLPFAGALAEALLGNDPVPLNARLARAALGPAPPARSESDRIAICVVRSVPDDVARLFAAAVASEAETATVAALDPIATACNRTGQRLELSPAGLRAMLATAAFRSLAAQPPQADDQVGRPETR